MRYKFRAYHKKKERLVDVLEIDFENNVVTLTIETDGDDEYYWWSSTCHLDEVELIQFTGLTDKNGREIYEGDIVSLQNPFDLINYKSLIIFKDGGFCAIDGTEENYAVRRYRLSDSDLEITVLGNIYEDGHLLKENEK